jgi:hypothetical protein
MSKKLWQNMTLTEKSQTYNKMRDRFPDKGASSASEAKIMQLCEMNIPADNEAIAGVIRGEISANDVRLLPIVKPNIESKPKAIFGERSIPEAMKLASEYNQTVSEDEQRSWHYFVSC